MHKPYSPSWLLRAAIALQLLPALAVADDAGTGAAGAGLEVVTVTAQKVNEDLQKASAAITVIAGDVLVSAGVYDIRGVQNLMPLVRFQAENASTELYIRGVGSTLDLPNIEPPNAFNFNGVYIPREGTSVGLFDIESIELLPGPQGTLYGRAALGGAVNVEFNRPTQELETSGVLEVGDYSLLHGTIVQNLPVSEQLALRGAVDYIERDGYLRTGADSQEDYAGRLSALYAPTDDLDVYVWLHGAKKDGKSPNLVRRGFNGGTFDGDPNAFNTSDPWDDRIDPGAPMASPQDFENMVLGAQVDWDLGDARLTYIPGYFYLDWSADYWLENIPALLTAHYNQVTNELRLASDSDSKLQWLGGLYAYQVTNSGDFIVGGFPLSQISRNRLEGYAAFGEATYSLTETVRVTAGGRFSWDQREGEGQTAFGEPFSADEEYDNVDWKLGVELDLGADAMAYATIQTGYQPGTYNAFPATDELSNLVQSATMTAYTAGIKSRFLDGRLQVNDEVFYYDYENLLVQSFNLNTALLTTFNADQTTIWGNQLDVLFAPTDRDRLNLSVGYLNAEYDDFVVPDDVNIGIPNRDFGGYPLQNAPEWTVSAGYQHEFPIGPGRLLARLETRYEDSFWGTFAQFRGTEQQDYFKTDAAVTYYAPDDRWSLGLWVKNIENEAVLAAATTGQFGPYADVFIEPPRTYGARFTFKL
ncbi:MAG: TonB-dependent receptor [Proteobacteria bacterium]|nr:TonB-dependent receptor [Pseudomonadota bacterium]